LLKFFVERASHDAGLGDLGVIGARPGAAGIAYRSRESQARSQERETGARRRTNDEGSMRPDDNLIIRHLDDEWRTAPAVHRLLGERGAVADIAYALERLARAGKIEAKHEAAMAPRYRDKAGPPVLSIDFYRKLQRRR
jgi:hypothetical protein